MSINIPNPKLQISFATALGQIRESHLQNALIATLEQINIDIRKTELQKYASERHLKLLSEKGVVKELVFPIPSVLIKNPRLLGYYRLLLGFSQKEFYTKKFGVSAFKLMETQGKLSDKNRNLLPNLCVNLSEVIVTLIEGIGIDRVTQDFLSDLTLLTLGPQLRGGANVQKGAEGIVEVFELIYDIVKNAVTKASPRKIEIVNAAARKVLIEFAPDPDIVITEEISEKKVRNIIAIEVKSGTDVSNIHNRIGEAEKSHQKARSLGYVECWTVVNVDGIDKRLLKQESPSTNEFYQLYELKNKKSNEYSDFKSRIVSLTGIPSTNS